MLLDVYLCKVIKSRFMKSNNIEAAGYVIEMRSKRIGDFIFAPGWTTYGKRLHGYGTTETVTFKHWRFVHGWTNSLFKRIMLQKTVLS